MSERKVKDKMICKECGDKLTTPREICGDCLYKGIESLVERIKRS